jgi:hypothetical protein
MISYLQLICQSCLISYVLLLALSFGFVDVMDDLEFQLHPCIKIRP